MGEFFFDLKNYGVNVTAPSEYLQINTTIVSAGNRQTGNPTIASIDFWTFVPFETYKVGRSKGQM